MSQNQHQYFQYSQKAQNVEGTPFSKIHMDDQQSNSSIVARSKSRHLVVMNNLKKREEMWDNRFYLQHIPKYDVFSDKHASNFQYSMMKQVKRNQIEFAPGRIRKKPTKDMQNIEEQSEKSIHSSQSQHRQVAPPYHPRPGGGPAGANQKNLIPPNYDQLKEMIKENFEKLKINWENLDIPIHHRQIYSKNQTHKKDYLKQEIFIQCCKQISRERAVELIKAEIEDLRKGDSFIQNCQKAVKGREQCILQIEDQILNIEKINNQIDEEILNKCSELITHLRLLSINAVECIVAWRKYLMDFLQSNATKERQVMIIPYLFKDQNYLIKMRTDSHFLRSSILKEYFYFSMRQEFKIDPFILSMTDSNEQTEKQIQYISKSLRRRIDNCIHLLNEEYIRVMEDEKFQQMNSKKPSYSRYQQKLPGVAPIRKSSQNSRIVSKPINQDQYNQANQGSGKKDHPSPNSSIQSKQSPSKQLNFDSSPSRQKRDSEGSNIDSNKHNRDQSQGELGDNQKQFPQNQNDNQNKGQNNQQKSTQSIYQQIKGPVNRSSSKQQSNIKDLSQSKSQPHHPITQQNTQPKQDQFQQKQLHQTQQEPPKKENQMQTSQSSNTILKQQQQQQQHVQKEQENKQKQQQNVHEEIHVQDQREEQQIKQQQNQDQQQQPQEAEDDNTEGVIGVPDYGEEDLIKYTEEYLKQVEKKIKESVLSSTQEISRRLRTEYECGCLEYKKNGKLKGIAYYFNESSQQSRRITLMHVSATDQKNLDQFLNQIISYIFSNDSCDEIRFCIYHHENEEGNMQVHKEIQNIFTSKQFKWKQVNNDKYTHQRTTILALRRPANIPSTHTLKQFDHIVVESVATIQHSSSAVPSSTQNINNFDMTVNLLGCFDLVIQQDPKFATLLASCENKLFQKGMDQINILMRKNYGYSDMKKEIFENKSKMAETLKQYEINFDTSSLLDSQVHSSVSKLALKWRAFSQCTIENQFYLRMNTPSNDDHNYMKANSKINKMVYILPTDDQNTNIFLFEIDKTSSIQLDNKEAFLSDFQQNVKDVMKSLENTQQMKEDLFIPAFETILKSNSTIKNQDGSLYTCSQHLKISINYNTPLPKMKINIQKNSPLQIIIKPPFVFGFINNEIDDILEIPYYSSLIEKEDCSLAQI